MSEPKTVSLTNGLTALVDNLFYEELSFYTWWMSDNRVFRANPFAGRPGETQKVGMAIQVMKLAGRYEEGRHVYHYNGCPTDNRKDNLTHWPQDMAANELCPRWKTRECPHCEALAIERGWMSPRIPGVAQILAGQKDRLFLIDDHLFDKASAYTWRYRHGIPASRVTLANGGGQQSVYLRDWVMKEAGLWVPGQKAFNINWCAADCRLENLTMLTKEEIKKRRVELRKSVAIPEMLCPLWKTRDCPWCAHRAVEAGLLPRGRGVASDSDESIRIAMATLKMEYYRKDAYYGDAGAP